MQTSRFQHAQDSSEHLNLVQRIGLPTDDLEFPSFSEIVLDCWEKIPLLPQLPLGQPGCDLGTGNYLGSFGFAILLETQEDR